MNCRNCGSNVNPGDMFCQNCGAGINNSSSNQNPVISDEVLVDAYIGKNIEEIRKGNFSWCTFFFDVFYAFYRKMWLFGILYLLSYLVWAFLIVILIVLLVKQTNEITFIQNYVKYYSIIYGGIIVTSLALRLIFSFKFKKAYLKHATKKVEQIKVRNMGKTNEEIKKECSKKGGTSIFGIFLAILLPIILYLLLAIPYAIQTKNTLDKVQNSVAKDSAYIIIEEVEMAYFSASIDKELITLEDVRNEYEGKFSTWSGNVIKSTHYDFTCDVTVNNDNKMLVSCDLFGEKIESGLFDLNVGKKENNQANDNQNNETDKESVNNNKEEVNNVESNNISYKIVDETSNEGVVFKQLYVNGKEVSFENKATNIEVIQMNDILIVETALSSKTLYAVSKDADVIGVFTTRNNNFYKNTNIIPTKYTYRDTYRIEGNSIYIQTDKLSQDSKYALCNLLASKDDEVVLYEEKFEYLGNNKFSTPIITNKITRKEYMQEHNINCN